MLQLKSITKEYVMGAEAVKALKNISVAFRKNEFVSILGPSGGGKTTLLNIIGGLDHYIGGDLIIDGKSTKKFSDRDWDSYRNHSVGFVFQSYNLIAHQSVLANVELALTLSGVSKNERKRRAKAALEQVGLGNQLRKRPSQLSGGQMQRVAIARALVNDPEILLADEPTGALDTETSIQVLDILKKVAKNRLVIMVTHNPELTDRYSTRIIKLRDGEIVDDTNPLDGKEKENGDRKQERTSMRFSTALSLSFNNLRTKKGRTILTAIAGSIGFIGIALIMALSFGVNQYITELQKNTLTSYPISIKTMASHMGFGRGPALREVGHDMDRVYANKDSLENEAATTNNLTAFKKYLDDPNSEIHQYIGENGIIYSYATPFSVYTYDPEGALISTAQANFGELMPGYTDGALIGEAITDGYEVAYGSWPTVYNEAVLVLDEYNELSVETLYQLGFLPNKEYQTILDRKDKGASYEVEEYQLDYADICNRVYYLIPACDTFREAGNGVYENFSGDISVVKEVLEDAISLKITGIIRPKDHMTEHSVSLSTISYTNALTDYLVTYSGKNSLVQAQLASPDINILTGEVFDEDMDHTYAAAVEALGIANPDTPSSISIYANNFEDKEAISDCIERYNKSVSTEEQISYMDIVALLMSSVTSMVNMISYVLIAFVSVSLLVSSIMIGIITYISVLERTREIGILRAIGASKRDISRVFNAENVIVGLSAGALGVGIAYLLCIPINLLLHSLIGSDMVSASLPILTALILAGASTLLTLISGFLPSCWAAKKDPIAALRSE